MSLYESSSEEALSTVRQDLPRTFPSHALFLAPAGPGAAVATASEPAPGCRRRSLYHILASYASFDTAVGYCQGEQRHRKRVDLCSQPCRFAGVVLVSRRAVLRCRDPVDAC